ncbi:MAG: TerY-C metal binding domain-containing protein [Phycisphaeraceae bacterium]
MQQRRLPVYLMLDCSESMAGPAIDAVNLGVKALVKEVQSNPHALETVYLSVITFARYAKQVAPLTEAIRFQPPQLKIQPGTAMGAALALLMDRLTKEVKKTTATTKGDYRPLVFLLTDGQPTDNWQPAVEAFRKMQTPRVASVYAIGCGPDVDTGLLRRITDVVLMMPEMSPESIRKFFVWLSASIQAVSQKVGGEGGDHSPLDIKSIPPDLMRVIDETFQQDDSHRELRQVFLHAKCSKTRSPYLMRFSRSAYGGTYEAVAAHKLEAIEEGDAESLAPINSSQLAGVPPCPYCGNLGAAVCPCGTTFCDDPNNTAPVTCPGCHASLGMGGTGSFDIKRSQG